MKKTIFVSSKTRHAEMWRRQRDEEWIPIQASWIDATNDTNMRYIWQQAEEDIVASSAVIVYAEGDDRLKGSLVEVGMALVLGRPVFAVGVPEDHSWRHHPKVKVCRTLEQAFMLAVLHMVGNG